MSLFHRSDKSSEPQQKPQMAQPQAGQAAQSAQPKAESAAQKVSDPKPAEPVAHSFAVKPSSPPTTKTGVTMASVISKALKITGELESTEDIQIDGQIEGDVRGVGVKIGQNAKVKGTVYGDEVELAGTIEGRIEAKKVVLAGTARMTGDISHQDIKIESGAYINGMLKPELGKSESRPASKPVAVASNVSPMGASAAGTAH